MSLGADDEILRLRNRLHDVESRLVGTEIHVRDFVRWREQIEPIIDELREADRIAETVAEKMREERGNVFTTRQVWTAIASVCVAAGALALDVLHGFGVIR